MTGKGEISIWFFIGVSLLINGLLIAGAGIYEFVVPPQHEVVLHHLHASLWWGLVLALIGAIYCFKYVPKRDCAESRDLEVTALKCEGVHAK